MGGPGAYRESVPNSVNFDRMADRYDETRGGVARGRTVAAGIAPHLPPGRILEIGVGTGLIAAALGDLGRDVVGVDLSERMLGHAANRMPGRLARADASKLPVATGSIDVCLAVHLMHLVGDAPTVVAEVARVLRPGGRWVVVRGGQDVDHSDITRVIDVMQARLDDTALRERESQLRALAATAERAGLRLVDEFEIAGHSGRATPAEAADSIEQRLWSRLWDISAEMWDEVVVPTVAELRGLPDQDRPRTAILRSPVHIFAAADA
jgi:ubiquinone/menaquinone biosynthesis C-methylase UbiE